ncbi:MAG: hypothetical protein ACE5GF_07745 [Thermodesulfobacteriota bacterium]
MKRRKSLLRGLFPLFTLALSLVIIGCAAKGGVQILLPAETDLTNYTASESSITFADDSLKIAATPRHPYTSIDHPSIVQALLKKGYPIFSITIESLSKKIIYNPSFSIIIDNRLGFNRPLDYTDLYFLVRSMDDGEEHLKEMKGRFYDLAETVPPGNRVEKLLIFRPLEEKSSKATLVMQEVYVETETIKLSFPFRLTTEKELPAGKRE